MFYKTKFHLLITHNQYTPVDFYFAAAELLKFIKVEIVTTGRRSETNQCVLVSYAVARELFFSGGGE